MKKKMNNKGFSLVELIIVIAIMAVLVAVLAPQYIKFVEKSRESTDLDNVQALKTAIEAYVADKQLSGTAAEFSITLPATANTAFTITGTTTGLTDYGVDITKIKTKSGTWTGTCKWEYKDYKWSEPAAGAHAQYLNCDGSEYVAP